jgi:uncharacterized protein
MLGPMALPRALKIDIPNLPLRLEGRASGEGPLAVIAPPHPLYGGSIGNPVVRALELALRDSGLATLAFNFRGTGDSDGEPSEDLEQARVDYRAAVDAVANVTLLSGYSFGSVAALAVAGERKVPRVLMVAPPMALLDLELLARYQGELSVIIGDQDEYMPAAIVRDLFAERANTRLEILPDVDHFFLGSAVAELAAGLRRLLR